jgi:hypothetical protein
MKQIAFVVGLVLLIVSARTQGAPSQDALAMLRAALGGEAALAAVQNISARGTINRAQHKASRCQSSRTCEAHFELAVALPDRFVRTVHSIGSSGHAWSIDEWGSRNSISWPQRGEVLLTAGGGEGDTHTSVTGFNREAPIPAPTWYEIKEHPEYVAPRLDSARARFAEFVLPLMGATPASYPVVARSEAYAVTFSAVGGREWRLELDPVTHLPARISWTYTLPPTPPGAGAVLVNGSRMSWDYGYYGAEGPVRSISRFPPALTTSKSQTMSIDCSDFRLVSGLRWPHRLITYRDGDLVEDMTVTRYQVNVKVSDKMFKK